MALHATFGSSISDAQHRPSAAVRRLALLIVPLLLGAALLSGARLSFINVEPRGNDFVVTWQSDTEDGVLSYELHRKTTTSNNDYALVSDVGVHGTGRTYSVVDDQIFKSASELIEYRLQAVLSDGSRQVLASTTVNYTPTAVRRTWGSIKAMF